MLCHLLGCHLRCHLRCHLLYHCSATCAAIRFEVLVDGEVRSSGSLFESLEPSINPPKELPDPEDKKPADWVDEAM